MNKNEGRKKIKKNASIWLESAIDSAHGNDRQPFLPLFHPQKGRSQLRLEKERHRRVRIDVGQTEFGGVLNQLCQILRQPYWKVPKNRRTLQISVQE